MCWERLKSHILCCKPFHICSIEISGVSPPIRWIPKWIYSPFTRWGARWKYCQESSLIPSIYILIHTYCHRTLLCNFKCGIHKFKYRLPRQKGNLFLSSLNEILLQPYMQNSRGRRCLSVHTCLSMLSTPVYCISLFHIWVWCESGLRSVSIRVLFPPLSLYTPFKTNWIRLKEYWVN